jgi:putative Mn2+ efflux pump MntP
MDLITWGQLITLMIMALAISMDAFSIGIGVGMVGVRLRHILKISITIGAFHFIMPLVGILIGHFLSRYIGSFATFVGGVLLIILGAHMLWSSLFGKEGVTGVPSRGIPLLLFAFSVSIDALSIGFSLGLFSVNTWLTIALFGFWGTIMTMLGLLLGRNVGSWLGEYGEAFGGMVLLALGFKFLI